MSELLFEHDDRIFPDLFRIFPVTYLTNLVASSTTRDCPALLPTLTHDWTRIVEYSHTKDVVTSLRLISDYNAVV
jgi:hypothetical protein